MNSRILPILALLISIGIFFAYINPTWNGSIASAKAAISADSQALASADTFTKTENQLASEQASMSSSDLNQLAAMVPDSVDNVGIILDLNALAARTGLSLSNIDIAQNSNQSNGQTTTQTTSATPTNVTGGAASSEGPVGNVDLSLSAIGTYASLKQFLVGIEHSQRLLDVRDLSIKSSKTGVYNYQMTIRLYWLR